MSIAVAEKSLLEILRERLPEYLRRSGRILVHGKMRCLNPEHMDREPSMGYDVKTKRLHCFGCGKSYDLFDVIALDDPDCIAFSDQVRKACEMFGLPAPEKELVRPRRVALRGSAKQGDYTAFVEEAIKRCQVGGAYFLKRGISQELCEKYRLFEKDGRAYLPVWRNGVCVAYCARAIDGGMPRYRNSPGPMALFNGDLLEDAVPGDMVVAESVFDALAAEMCGMRAVALCGAANVARFLRACRGKPGLRKRRFLLAGDADEAGQRMNRELEQGLSALGLKSVWLHLPEGTKDLNDALISNRRGLEAALRMPGGKDEMVCAASFLGALRPSQKETAQCISTGLPVLDRMLGGGMYPGLYVLGAISSLGKTSLALQIADAIAENGRDVVYFSLEMSRMELIAKSISRWTCQLDGTVSHSKALDMRQVMYGASSPLLERAVKRYANGAGKRIYFIENPVGSSEVRQIVQQHARQKQAPAVIVDYLQILRPADGRATDKQNTDRAVVELKRLSRDFQIPVLAISSFNRENYRNAVSMEAFKESGAVEYSSDVLLGMQLAGAGEARFDANTAKLRSPRNLQLVMLKNRAGAPYAVMALRYLAKYSLFFE